MHTLILLLTELPTWLLEAMQGSFTLGERIEDIGFGSRLGEKGG